MFWWRWKLASMKIPLALPRMSGNDTPVFGLVPLFRIRYCMRPRLQYWRART
jgi:hypothetical protein